MKKSIWNFNIFNLGFSIRVVKVLYTLKKVTLRDLVLSHEDEFLVYKNFGTKSLAEIKSILMDLGLGLRMKKSYVK